ncbi:FxLD family lanthipeptide [Streptomyces sp. NBC_01187]|uniref:FxLD family lanthipeptide n=1 Tax=Streptomyces sp. NBC_01187 TaxID=2903766 RepID=UPI0038708FBF|nr:FxLD family lanthipeptide [Streptomyces sp. NBC_01187]
MTVAHEATAQSAAPMADPFDLDISILPIAPAAEVPLASDDSCAATCGTSCASNVA